MVHDRAPDAKRPDRKAMCHDRGEMRNGRQKSCATTNAQMHNEAQCQSTIVKLTTDKLENSTLNWELKTDN